MRWTIPASTPQSTTAQLASDSSIVSCIHEGAPFLLHSSLVNHETLIRFKATPNMALTDLPVIRYINHSCNPTCARSFIGDLMIVRVARDIPAETELTFGYMNVDEPVELNKKLSRMESQRSSTPLSSQIRVTLLAHEPFMGSLRIRLNLAFST
jgi:hypothetical protein